MFVFVTSLPILFWKSHIGHLKVAMNLVVFLFCHQWIRFCSYSHTEFVYRKTFPVLRSDSECVFSKLLYLVENLLTSFPGRQVLLESSRPSLLQIFHIFYCQMPQQKIEDSYECATRFKGLLDLSFYWIYHWLFQYMFLVLNDETVVLELD